MSGMSTSGTLETIRTKGVNLSPKNRGFLFSILVATARFDNRGSDRAGSRASKSLLLTVQLQLVTRSFEMSPGRTVRTDDTVRWFARAGVTDVTDLTTRVAGAKLSGTRSR
jgi:hypothetical protein